MGAARAVPKVDFGGLWQRDLGTSARRPACLDVSGLSSNFTLQEGEGRGSHSLGQQIVSRGRAGCREAGRRKMIRQPGSRGCVQSPLEYYLLASVKT